TSNSNLLIQPLTLNRSSPPANSSNNLPSLLSKIIYIRPIDSISNEEVVQFRFVPSDSKEDIKEEISKAFNLERFSLRDDKKNIVTGSWDSLVSGRYYEIIDRGESNVVDRKWKKYVDFGPKRVVDEFEYTEELPSESYEEDKGRNLDGRSINNKRDTTIQENESRKKRKSQSHLTSTQFLLEVKQNDQQQHQQLLIQSHQEPTESRMSVRRALLTPEDVIVRDNMIEFAVPSANHDVFEEFDSGIFENTNNINRRAGASGQGKQPSKRVVRGSSRSGQVKACSRCRKGKKGCDRKRPCERCIKAGMEDSCDTGEPRNDKISFK
ncbi:9094_t:CDS:2, partial [Ambispora leptoticha]